MSERVPTLGELREWSSEDLEALALAVALALQERQATEGYELVEQAVEPPESAAAEEAPAAEAPAEAVLPTPAPTEEEPAVAPPIVYVTQWGRCYHVSNACRQLRCAHAVYTRTGIPEGLRVCKTCGRQ